MEPSGEEPNDDAKASSNAESVEDYETLKYQLLGPSLTKAGQDAVDQRKVSSMPQRSRMIAKVSRSRRSFIMPPKDPNSSIMSKTETRS